MNILTEISKIKIIGTISIAGKIREINEIQVAEKPNPLKPLIIDATKTVRIINKNSNKLNSKSINKFIKTYTYQQYTLPKL
tara:strand:- start:78 stop:320 length:243 start_codon:yes stop_codon:yes gene_type:complete